MDEWVDGWMRGWVDGWTHTIIIPDKHAMVTAICSFISLQVLSKVSLLAAVVLLMSPVEHIIVKLASLVTIRLIAFPIRRQTNVNVPS